MIGKPRNKTAAPAPGASLAQADEARDAGRWPDAARLYRQVLAADPARGPIWVQLGHALKESGDLAGAEEAYRQAIDIDANDPDFHIQLGHLLKLKGDRLGAERAYFRALEADDASAPAMQELIGLGADLGLLETGPREALRHEEGLTFDLSDVFTYLKDHDTVSGIQRVQLGLSEALIALSDQVNRPIRFVVESGLVGGYVEVASSCVTELIAELRRERVRHERLIAIMRRGQNTGRVWIAQPGDVVVVLGAFWVIPSAGERYMAIRKAGARLVVLIHDIIPITHPEFCVAHLTGTFNALCPHMLQISDLVLTVSDHTRSEVERFIASRGLKGPPVRTLKLVHETWTPQPAILPSRLPAGLVEREYVLFVSTIEVRKNHLLLFKIWRELLSKYGQARVPKLVFVGRQGWRVQDLMDQLESTRRLNGAIVILNGLSDAELGRLYEESLFTVFPSFEEGWGLPVGESLIHGRPCVASSAASIPEVGGSLVLYAEPDDFPTYYALVERMVLDREFCEAQAKVIAEEFQPRRWAEVAEDLVGLLEDFVPVSNGAPASQPFPPVLAGGRLHRVGHEDDEVRYIREGLGEIVHFAFDEGWGRIENFGRWMSRTRAEISVSLDRSGPGEIMLVAMIESPGWRLPDTGLRLSINGADFEPVKPVPGEQVTVVLKTRVAGPSLDLSFDVEGLVAMGSDPRPLCFGLRSIGYCWLDDLQSRVSLIEDIAFSALKTIRPLALHTPTRPQTGW